MNWFGGFAFKLNGIWQFVDPSSRALVEIFGTKISGSQKYFSPFTVEMGVIPFQSCFPLECRLHWGEQALSVFRRDRTAFLCDSNGYMKEILETASTDLKAVISTSRAMKEGSAFFRSARDKVKGREDDDDYDEEKEEEDEDDAHDHAQYFLATITPQNIASFVAQRQAREGSHKGDDTSQTSPRKKIRIEGPEGVGAEKETSAHAKTAQKKGLLTQATNKVVGERAEQWLKNRESLRVAFQAVSAADMTTWFKFCVGDAKQSLKFSSHDQRLRVAVRLAEAFVGRDVLATPLDEALNPFQCGGDKNHPRWTLKANAAEVFPPFQKWVEIFETPFVELNFSEELSRAQGPGELLAANAAGWCRTSAICAVSTCRSLYRCCSCRQCIHGSSPSGFDIWCWWWRWQRWRWRWRWRQLWWWWWWWWLW